MKSLVYFKPSSSSASFEGVRLRKNLKGALELSSIPWVDSVYADPEIIHIISPDDESIVKTARLEGAKVVTSAFYCENDPNARFLERNSMGGFVLTKPAFKLLSESDLVLVPSAFCMDFVRAQGLSPRMEVLSPGVNLARFEEADPDETGIFFRYFRIPQGTPYCLSVGDLNDEDVKKGMEQIAFLVPEMKFFFLGYDKKGGVSNQTVIRFNKSAPSNLTYSSLVEDDVYRSALINAKAIVLFDGSHPNNITALEAMASRVQIFSLGTVAFPDLIEDKKNAYCFMQASELAKSLQSHCLGKLKSTIIEGYKTATENSLTSVGARLKSYYESLL